MQLFLINGSGNSRKVQAVINHLGIEVDYQYLDWLAADHKKPGYLSINPNGRVPTLRDGDFTLWESNAIMQYLADRVPGNRLYPTDPRQRADIARWQSWETTHFNRWLGVLVFETVLKPQFMKQPPDDARVQAALPEMKTFAGVLEAHLENRQFLVGDELTLADYSLVQQESFASAIPFDWNAYPNILSYFERMRAVPHWCKTAPRPGEAGRIPKAA